MKKYQEPEMKIITFQAEDVVRTSDPNELPPAWGV